MQNQQRVTKGHSKRLKHLFQLVAASAATGVLTLQPAFAAPNGTWNGATSNYNLGTNWTPNGTPTDTATFANSGVTGVSVTAATNINELLFAANAQAYSITNNAGQVFNINGIGTPGNLGISNVSGNAQSIINNGTLQINNNSQVAGGVGVTLTNNSILNISGTANTGASGNVTLNTRGGNAPNFGSGTAATANFNDSATSGNANVNNTGGNGALGGAGGSATLNFNDNSNAGTGNLTNTGGTAANLGAGGSATLNFNDNSVIGTGTLTNAGGTGANLGAGGAATVNFNNTEGSTGATTITNTGATGVAAGLGGAATINYNGSTSGSTILNNTGGSGAFGGAATVNFNNGSTAGTSVINNTGGGGLGLGVVNFNASNADESQITNTNGAFTAFNTGATAGDATIINENTGGTFFNNNSTAGSATITNLTGGLTTFGDSSNAGTDFNNKASIINNGGGTIFQNLTASNPAASGGEAAISNINGGTTTFLNNTTSGNADITNGGTGLGTTTFNGTSTQGLGSSIINNDGGTTNFLINSSSLGTIQNNSGGVTRFQNNSSAGSTAFITNNSSGSTFFQNNATGNDDLRVTNNLGGIVDISGLTNGGINIGLLSGSGDTFLGANTLTTGGVNNSATISGVIQDGGESGGGGGSLTKEGTGVLTLTGSAKSYTGATTINNGTLDLRTTITSDTTVNAGGTLTGDGFIGDFTSATPNTLTNNGTVNAGDGTTGQPLSDLDSSLFINGDFTNNVTGIIVSRVTGNGTSIADSNSIINRGNIVLNGGQVQANVTSANPNGLGSNGFGMQTRAVIAGTLGGYVVRNVDPTLDDTNVPSYLDASLDYDSAGVVLLLLRRNTTGLNTLSGLSFNQRNVGEVLEDNVLTADPAFFNLYNSVLLSNNPQRALGVVSGDALTSFPLATQQAAMRFSERVRQHLLTRWTNANATRTAGLPSARFAYTGTRFKTLLAANPDAMSSRQAGDAMRGDELRRSNIWATIARARDNADGDGNGPDFDARATEYQVGYDRAAGRNTVVGISVGRSNGRLNVDDRSATGDFDTTSVGLYVAHDSGANDAVFWNGVLSYNRHNINSRRSLVGGSARGDYDGRTIGVEGEVGKRFGKGSYAIEPNLFLKLNNTRQDSFSESGGPGALNVDGDNYNTRRVGIGVRFVNRKANARIRPNLSLSYEHEFGDTQSELSNQLIGLGSNFTVRSTDLGENIFRVSLGADARLNDRFSLTGQIGLARRSNQHSEYIYGGLNYGF